MSEPVTKGKARDPELEAPAGGSEAAPRGEDDGKSGTRRGSRLCVKARDVPEAVQWQEGMLLAPEHFQQLAYRQEALLHYHAGMIDPYHWGVRDLEIDRGLLGEGVFRVSKLDAVMPDGLVVSLPNHGSDLSVDLSGEERSIRRQPLAIHLAVAARRAAGVGVDAEDGRFESAPGDPVADENTGSGELRVPRLRPRLRLLATNEPPPKYVSLPLAEATYDREGKLTTTPFVPPTLRVTPGSPLAKLCADVATGLRKKAHFLSEQVREPSSSVREPQLLETRVLVHAIVGGLPPFEALLQSGVAHPFALYLALCSVVGHVASIGRRLMPPVLEPYDHNDARPAFEAARAFIEQALREGVIESYDDYTFYLAEGAFFLKFVEQWLTRPLVLGVRSQPGAPRSEVEAWVEGAVIAAKSRMPELRQKRVLGLRRKRIEADGDLVPVRGVLLYSLGADPDLVVPGELLEIRNPDDPAGRLQPLEIVLYVRR